MAASASYIAAPPASAHDAARGRTRPTISRRRSRSRFPSTSWRVSRSTTSWRACSRRPEEIDHAHRVTQAGHHRRRAGAGGTARRQSSIELGATGQPSPSRAAQGRAACAPATHPASGVRIETVVTATSRTASCARRRALVPALRRDRVRRDGQVVRGKKYVYERWHRSTGGRVLVTGHRRRGLARPPDRRRVQARGR